MKERKRYPLPLRAGAFLLALLLFAALTWGAAWLLMPQRKEYGALWEQYLQEPEDSIDVLFFGSSITYCDVAPAWIWEESGLRSWVLAGPEQTLPLTYYYAREALKTQSPRLLVLEGTGLFFRRYQSYSKANVSTMPFSLNRLGATLFGAERAEWKGLLFPLYNYHYRWTEVREEELREHLTPERDAFAGYMPLSRAIPQEIRLNRDRTMERADYEESLNWLAKLQRFCLERGVPLLLYLSPSAARTDPALCSRVAADAERLGIEFLDLSELGETLGVDNEQDWYDPLHFNSSGAEKFSRWWGRTLLDRGLVPVGEDRTSWQERLDALNARVEAMNEEEISAG